MKKALAAMVTAGILVTGCGDGKVTGTVVEKDYDAAYSSKRHCTGSAKNIRRCKKKPQVIRHAAEWELTIRDSSGEEHEKKVTQTTFDKVKIGDRFTG